MKYKEVFLTIGVPILSLIVAVVIFFAFRIDRRSPPGVVAPSNRHILFTEYMRLVLSVIGSSFI